jgi:hypothetical protein
MYKSKREMHEHRVASLELCDTIVTLLSEGLSTFSYQPRVELEEAHSIYDVQRFHILLVLRLLEFSTYLGSNGTDVNDDEEMNTIGEGADAVPAAPTTDIKKKPFRFIAVGKKSLPDPEARGKKPIFWATIVTVGKDLGKLRDELGVKEYETKTRGKGLSVLSCTGVDCLVRYCVSGTRHQGPARIAAHGAYAIVNNEARTPSSRETHLGYHISHPTSDNFGEVQKALGIHQASSLVLQVKNPDAPNNGSSNVGLPKGRRAEFPKHIMKDVFGQGGGRGRESYGLRFASVERREMLDYEGTELLLIAARSGEEGLESSLGEGRGNGESDPSIQQARLDTSNEALTEAEKAEENRSVESVLNELAIDAEEIPAEPLEGEWE